MVDVVILAGGPVKETYRIKLKRLYHKIINKETYLWGKYKPTKKIKINGEKRPMLDCIIETASNMELSDNIDVVCEKDLVEDELRNKKYSKHIGYIQQDESLLENTLKGYGDRKAHVLFLPCDIPETKSTELDDFVRKCLPFQENYDFLAATVAKESMPKDTRKIFRRRYAWMIDDCFDKESPEYFGQNWFNKSIDFLTNIYAVLRRKKHLIDISKPQRRGFRPGNLMFLNLSRMENQEGINDLYSIRKLRDVVNIFRAAKEAFPEAVTYYRGRLTLSRFDDMISRFLKTRYKTIETTNSSSEHDIDSEEDLKDLEE